MKMGLELQSWALGPSQRGDCCPNSRMNNVGEAGEKE